MGKRIVLVHGWTGTPKKDWFPWMQKKLKQKGFTVIAPLMPDTENPDMQLWVALLKKTVGESYKRTFLVGHSLGCIAILRYLESLEDQRVFAGVLFVAGFSHDLQYDEYKNELKSFFQTRVDWIKVRKHCKKFVAIHSIDDQWVPVKHVSIFRDNLGAETIIEKGMKHYTSEDGIIEAPTILDAIRNLVRQ